MKRLLVITFLVAIQGFALTVTAMEPKTLPAFTVTARDGQKIPSDQLPQSGHWLLLYIQPQCVPCKDLLYLLKQDQLPTSPQKIIVVFGGQVEELPGIMAEFADLPVGVWYADPEGKALAALKLPGVPVALGVEQDTIQWTLSGTLEDTDRARSILTSWVAE